MLLAKSLPELLPGLSENNAVEVASIHSAAGVEPPLRQQPPLWAPHHSASAAAMVGGGPLARPGEVSLSHRGVLFLDEMPHYGSAVLDHLREPLQEAEIRISRARLAVRYPAAFQLVAAMNPCPAGRTCKATTCVCLPQDRIRYQRRISEPLLDRIDLHVRVNELPANVLAASKRGTSADELRARVAAARKCQISRQGVLTVRLIRLARGKWRSSARRLRRCWLLRSSDNISLRAALTRWSTWPAPSRISPIVIRYSPATWPKPCRGARSTGNRADTEPAPRRDPSSRLSRLISLRVRQTCIRLTP